jgi:hypothetical protein
VSAELAEPGPDATVVVETAYEQFMTDEYQEWLATSPYDWSRSCYMIHSTPDEQVDSVAREVKSRARYVFVTSARKCFYET